MTNQERSDEERGRDASRRLPAKRSVLAQRKPPGWERWLSEPRSAVLFVLASVIVVGGGRRLVRAWRARAAVALLEGKDVTPEAIVGAVEHGRAGLFDLFRLLGEAPTEPLRQAAGQAISVLWARDELIAEEEKALVRRGLRVDWRARKRYPRALKGEIPISVSYGLPFLEGQGGGVAPEQLEWSHRIIGARRASLEGFSPWTPSGGLAEFTLVPADFETEGPHRLVLQPRVRTAGLTESWELELPHMLFSFEFDPILTPAALLALPDPARTAELARRIRLVHQAPRPSLETPTFVPLDDAMALRDPPDLQVSLPLPNDLAHAIAIEFEGIAGHFQAGRVVLGGQGSPGQADGVSQRFPISAFRGPSSCEIDRPGPRRIRAVLLPDLEIGWGDPSVRSLWPEPIFTNWIDVEVVRR